jgi:hypothetical protein
MPRKKPGDPGLYDAIHAKRERIARGSGERMRSPGSKGAPTDEAFKAAAKTAKRSGGMVKQGYAQGGCVMASRGGKFKGNM